MVRELFSVLQRNGLQVQTGTVEFVFAYSYHLSILFRQPPFYRLLFQAFMELVEVYAKASLLRAKITAAIELQTVNFIIDNLHGQQYTYLMLGRWVRTGLGRLSVTRTVPCSNIHTKNSPTDFFCMLTNEILSNQLVQSHK